VDTEHGFRPNLKAIWAGFWQILRGTLTLALSRWERGKGEGNAGAARIGGERGAGTKAKQAGGENGRNFAEPFVGGHAGGIVVRSHGTSPCGSAHSDLRGAAGRLSGGANASTY
jgi:hypothetical protein